MTIKKLFFYIIVLQIYTITSLGAQQVAFPGAEGFGAYTTGGRSGEVYEVTNLNNSGTGSLRDAVSQSNRTIVFRVSGYIELSSALRITGSSLTIAGQTAPGDGICVRDYPTIVEGDNIIIRYLRFRLGDKFNLSSDAFNINDRKNIIIDHCSISWGGDECASWYGNENVTIQWCMIGEGLSYLGHSMGGLWGGNSSYHHNLIYTCGSRHPKFAYTYDEDITDHRNNVIYNWGYESAYTSPTGRVNIVANYYKYGPSTSNNVRNRIVYSEYDTKRLYVSDNYVFDFPEITADNWNGGVHGVPIRHDYPFPAPAISQQSAEQAYNLVLTYAGASFSRDSIDLRILENVSNGTGKIIARPGDVGGFPVLKSTDPPDDTDHDGMPDDYEIENQLNINNPDDRNDDKDNDGFTNLENYLNSLIPVDWEDLGSDTTLPAVPSNLKATTFSGNQIDLSWTDNATNERGFRIQCSNDGWKTYKEETKALANITSCSIEGLSGSSRYEFKVATYNKAGTSEYSEIASDSTIAHNHFFLWTSVDGPGRILLNPDSSNYKQGSIIQITAIPDSGYVFDTWLNDLSGVKNPETVTINTSIKITAKFAIRAYDIPLMYDFGPGPVTSEYTQITKSTNAYAVGRGYGFASISGLDERDRGAPDFLRRDFIVANSPQTFIVDLPNGEYLINVIAGDNMSNAPNGPMDVHAEGIKKISAMYSDGGKFDSQEFTIDITDGQLNLELIHSNSSSGTWRINALEISSTKSYLAESGFSAISEFELVQNYPNPFNSITTIKYVISENTQAKLTIYDILGREIAVLVDEHKKPAIYAVKFNAKNLPSGVYFYKLQTNSGFRILKFILMR